MSPIKWAAKAMTANSPTLEPGPRRLPVATASTFGAEGAQEVRKQDPGGNLWPLQVPLEQSGPRRSGRPEVPLEQRGPKRSGRPEGGGRRGARVPYTWEETTVLLTC